MLWIPQHRTGIVPVQVEKNECVGSKQRPGRIPKQKLHIFLTISFPSQHFQQLSVFLWIVQSLPKALGVSHSGKCKY